MTVGVLVIGGIGLFLAGVFVGVILICVLSVGRNSRRTTE